MKQSKLLKQVVKDLEEMELQLLFQDKYDHNTAILSLHAGAGGYGVSGLDNDADAYVHQMG